MLKIKDVYKVFNVNTINENRVFDGFSLQVEKGEYVSIIGSNGAGKSTLLNLITGKLPVDSGSIMIDGEEVVKKEEYYRCRYIGRVFQNPSVGVAPNMNILENMSLADNKGKPYGIKFAIDKKRINYYKEELKRLNLGLEDKLYNKVNLLSGGQRQRAWIAMALTQGTDILLLDEPTTYLDLSHQIEVLELLKELNRKFGKTIVIVHHELNQAAKYGDNLICMKSGKVYSTGTVDNVFNEKMLKEVFGVNAIIIDDPISNRPMCIPM